MIAYPSFCDRVRREYAKQASLHKIYRHMFEMLIFKETKDLYTIIFQRFDASVGEKRFTRADI
jgi:hypothetical protein